MIVLGIDTSDAIAVAVMSGRRSECAVGAGQALESLLPCVEEALERAAVSLEAIDLLGVCIGPGSFTGLRIGVAFVKSFGQAKDLPVIGVSSYDIAEHLRAGEMVVSAVRGKPGYFYARVRHADGTSSFAHGDAATVERLTGVPFSAIDPESNKTAAGERARRVATISAQRYAAGAPSDWRSLAIDYGQRPVAKPYV